LIVATPQLMVAADPHQQLEHHPLDPPQNVVVSSVEMIKKQNFDKRNK
jgi:hypothetical protein